MHLLSVSGIYKKDERGFELKNIHFTQQAFQNIAIAGETGSGKSTLVKIIAGLVQPDAGDVLFEGKKVIGPNDKLIPGHEGIAYLSQHFELRNYYRVEELLAYANTLSDTEAATLYSVCRIDHLLKRRTDQLSGGERQRIALARLLTGSPRLLILDEPFSNTDMGHKELLKTILHDIGEKLKITCLMVSHDPADALSWASQVLVMHNGQIVQQGSPVQVYTQPLNEYTAALFGKYNLFTPANMPLFPALTGLAGKGKKIIVRPEGFRITTAPGNALPGRVNKVLFFGSYYELEILLAAHTLIVRTMDKHFAKGDTVYLTLPAEEVWVME